MISVDAFMFLHLIYIISPSVANDTAAFYVRNMISVSVFSIKKDLIIQ